MIEIKNLNKYYNRHKKNEIHVINNSSISFDETGFTCIIGESGSGKTTFLSTISGLDSFNKGSIVYPGIEMNHYNSSKADKIRQSSCGYIFQNYYLLNNRTVYHNVAISLDGFELSPKERKERIEYVLKAVNMYKYKNKLVSQLSGGEAQRISIARALVKSPKVIFADEPTGSLDEKNTLVVLNILKKLSKKCLVIMVTHEASLVELYADRIIRIDSGTIISDERFETSSEVKVPMDRNIYLKEYNKEELSNNINLYNFSDDNKIKIDIIFKNGKYFISSNTNKLEYISDESEIKVIDDYQQVISDSSIENFNYDLEPISKNNGNNLTLKHIFTYAFDNIRFAGLKNLFVYIILFFVSILTFVSVQDLNSLNNIDYATILTRSSGNLEVDFGHDSYMTIEQKENIFLEVYDDITKNVTTGDLFPKINSVVYYKYSGFSQMVDISGYLSEYDFKLLDYFDESTIIYGSAPTKENEVVVDEWVINKFLNNNPDIKSVIKEPSYFVGQPLTTELHGGGVDLVISGICHTENPTVFVDKYYAIRMVTWGQKVGCLERLKKTNPEIYGSYTLNENEVLLPIKKEGLVNYGSKYSSSYHTFRYTAVGWVDMEYDLVISENTYKEYIKQMCNYKHTLTIMSNDSSEYISYINSYPKVKYDGEEELKFYFNVNDVYTNQKNNALNSAYQKIQARLIVTITSLFLSVFVIFFAMKSSANKQIADIAVFRALGFSRISFSMIYIVQLLITSLFTTLIGSILTVLVMKFLDAIPIIEFTYYLTSTQVVLVTSGLILSNILIGIIPIVSILALTPAKICSKYDL